MITIFTYRSIITIVRVKLQLQEFKNRGTAPPISYKLEPTFGMKPKTKSEYLKVDIKTQSGKANSKTILIYLPMFKTGSPEELLIFLTIIQKIIKGQSLTTGPKKYEIPNNLLAGEDLQ